MKIVIEIPEEQYKNLAKIVDKGNEPLGYWERVVMRGTPLSKGHGRLIDADEAIKVLKSLGSRDYRREKGTIQDAIKMLSYDEYTSTIIKADKEE